ncbi:MAG: glycosyltransferase family 2 protein [Pirellulaceae bacterium]
MSQRWLTALPVYNEAPYVERVLDQVRHYSPDVLVVDDGSRDDTPRLLAARRDIHMVRHPRNLGYGAALRTAFQYAIRHQYDCMVTIDCDGQHEPQRIPQFAAACGGVDIVSGSRYLEQFAGDSQPPPQRRWINQHLTAELNRRLGLQITDAFCGFKAYRVAALRELELTEDGYGMPLELWVQAACFGLKIVERPVPLIYLDDTRSFGGALDDATHRLDYYRDLLARSMAATSCRAARVSFSACGDGAG